MVAADRATRALQQFDLERTVILIQELLAAASLAQSASQGCMQPVDLPHSEASALWQTRKTIALRALFLLECMQGWLNLGAPNTEVLERMPNGRHSSLAVPLFGLLHQCLSGQAQPHLSTCMHAGHACSHAFCCIRVSSGHSRSVLLALLPTTI